MDLFTPLIDTTRRLMQPLNRSPLYYVGTCISTGHERMSERNQRCKNNVLIKDSLKLSSRDVSRHFCTAEEKSACHKKAGALHFKDANPLKPAKRTAGEWIDDELSQSHPNERTPTFSPSSSIFWLCIITRVTKMYVSPRKFFTPGFFILFYIRTW